jgi:hypothetical protein
MPDASNQNETLLEERRRLVSQLDAADYEIRHKLSLLHSPSSQEIGNSLHRRESKVKLELFPQHFHSSSANNTEQLNFIPLSPLCHTAENIIKGSQTPHTPQYYSPTVSVASTTSSSSDSFEFNFSPIKIPSPSTPYLRFHPPSPIPHAPSKKTHDKYNSHFYDVVTAQNLFETDDSLDKTADAMCSAVEHLQTLYTYISQLTTDKLQHIESFCTATSTLCQHQICLNEKL